MGRQAARREADPVEAGLETYHMERVAGTDLDMAFRLAIAAAVETANRTLVANIRDSLMQQALTLDEDEDNDLNDDGPAALLSYAKYLNDTLPHEYQLEQQ